MCEFCVQHGEGKEWYLQVKNYSKEVLYEKIKVPKDLELPESRVEMVKELMGAFGGGAGEELQKLDEAKRLLTPEEFHELSDKAARRAKYVHFGQVLPIEEVGKVLDTVDAVVRISCICRKLTIGNDDARYCFGLAMHLPEILGDMGQEMGSFELLQKDDAMKLMQEMDKEGLMHSIWTAGTPYILGICNCDQDCLAYRTQVSAELSKLFFKAEYVCRIDWDTCNGCKNCLGQCQFGAVFYSSAMKRCTIDLKRCYGCGVCRARCPEDAIVLEPRSKFAALQDVW